MPLKPAGTFDGAYALEKLASGARQAVAERDAARQRELSGQPDPELSAVDVFCVVERRLPPRHGDRLAEPRTQWDPQGTMPCGVPHFTVDATVSESLRNKESLADLLHRRLRREYRTRLLEAQLMPEAEARARVMRCKVSVVDVDPGLILVGG